MSFVIVLDPAHSEPPVFDGFDSGVETFSTTVEEKAITLRLAEKILAVIKSAEIQTDSGDPVEVHLTRQSDENPCQAERANVAKSTGADIFLSLQFNNFDSSMRGTQAWIDRKYHDGHKLKVEDPVTYATLGPGRPSSGVRNINHVDDANFASAVALAAYSAIKKYDTEARLLSATYYQEHHGENYLPPPGVKMKAMTVLRDSALSSLESNCLGCVLQLDFIDHPMVDSLFNGGAGSEFEDELAFEIAWAVIRCLK